MGIFDSDPAYQRLKQIREKEGYDGPLDQDLNREDPTSRKAQIADDLRRRGAGAR